MDLWGRFADARNPTSLASRFRSSRWDELLARFPDLSSWEVLDLGGTANYWASAPVTPRHVTIVNQGKMDLSRQPPWSTVLAADACTYEGRHVDLIISNSLIEHVGGVVRRSQLADVIQEHGDHFWVQTPYRYFPIEPHWLFPGFQWLPFSARIKVAKKWRMGGFGGESDPSLSLERVIMTELIGITELQHYFPKAEIWRERFLGVAKSIVAIR